MWYKPSTAWKLWEEPSAALNIPETGGKVHLLNIEHYNTGDAVYRTIMIGELSMGQATTRAS